eukprot:TRINITY_DN39000_c0_g1_i1.p1 TRINITY_DN39000_c0_g1~~TRINITY_DN39000_c0_g1_i1.p1  ORF type:complete len:373 (-),score=27.16 TRINITY_DN39000_c0_g1_i1:353-1402(-)
MGCVHERFGLRESDAVLSLPVKVPLRLELPNFSYMYIVGGRVVIADELSDVRNMSDRRTVVIGGPESSVHLRLGIRVQREASTKTLRTGGDCDLNEFLASSTFDVYDETSAELGDHDLVHVQLGWQDGFEHTEIHVYNMSGDDVCAVDCVEDTRLYDVKCRVAQLIGANVSDLHFYALDRVSLQLIISSVQIGANVLSPVTYVKDTRRLTTRLAKICYATCWDVTFDTSRCSAKRKLSVSCDGSDPHTIVRTRGNSTKLGHRRIDRKPRTAFVKSAVTDQCVAYANASACGPDAINTIFKGEAYLHEHMVTQFEFLKPVLAALCLVLAGADEEIWLRQKELNFGSASLA